jgi:cyclopropane-fatty-acyl-phospholipid synthase
VEDNNHRTVGLVSNAHRIEATIFIKNPRFYRNVLVAGSGGAAESFGLNHWSADNLTDALRIFFLNWSKMEQSHKDWNNFSAPVIRLLDLTRQTVENTNKQAFLDNKASGEGLDTLIHDETQSRTCGIFNRPNTTIAEAVSTAHERLCRKLRLQEGDNVLEVGRDVDGFANHAAKRYGCHVDTAISRGNQAQSSRWEATLDNVNERVRFVQNDYRQLEGRYDKLVIIEPFSSTNRSVRDIFFKECSRLLKDDGVLALQTVLRTAMSCRRFFGVMEGAGPCVQPNSCFPSLTNISRSIESNTDLRLIHFEDLTPHYAVTMKRWREHLYANVNRARDAGISEYALRTRAFDLCLGEAAFLERIFGCAQLIFAKSLSRHKPILPPLASKFGVILQKRKNDIENWLS